MGRCPFIIVEDFLPPSLCEEIVDEVAFTAPVADPEHNMVEYQSVKDTHYEQIIFERLQPLIPEIEKHYDVEYRGTESVEFEYIPTGSKIDPQCESSEFIDGNWVKTKSRDFCCMIFLCDYNDNPPFDDDFECYGGKMEFINHKFGFNPQRGTLVIYPSDPRFANATTKITSGELFQIRTHMVTKTPYVYNPKQFPGNYQTWFS